MPNPLAEFSDENVKPLNDYPRFVFVRQILVKLLRDARGNSGFSAIINLINVDVIIRRTRRFALVRTRAQKLRLNINTIRSASIILETETRSGRMYYFNVVSPSARRTKRAFRSTSKLNTRSLKLRSSFVCNEAPALNGNIAYIIYVYMCARAGAKIL